MLGTAPKFLSGIVIWASIFAAKQKQNIVNVLFYFFFFIHLSIFIYLFLLLLFLSVQLDLFIDFYYICFFSNSLFCSYIINNADHLLSFAVVIYQL